MQSVVTLSDYNAAVSISQQQLINNGRQRSQISFQNEASSSQNGKSYGQPLIVDETKQYMEGLVPDEDSDDEMNKDDKGDRHGSKKTRGRVKIRMEFIQNKLRRYTTFSKRKTGIMKKVGT